MITLTNLKWGNCFSYLEDNELVLNAEPITQLVGINGAGKTSIPILIQEVLFGKNIKGIKKQDISNRYTDVPGYWINLKFEAYDDTYEIKLNRNKTKLTLTLLKNNLDISSHTAVATYKTIAEVIGFTDFKMVSQLLYQSSTTNLEFLTATDTNRKKFLVSLLKLDKYLVIHEEFKDISRNINKDIIAANAKLEHINSWIKKHSIMDLTEMVEKLSIPIPEGIVESMASVKSKIEHIKTINKTIVNNNQYKKDLSEVDMEAISGNYTKYDKNAVETITESIGGLKASSNAEGITKKKFSALEGIHECPTCFQGINEEGVTDLLNTANTNIDTYASQVRELQKDLKTWETIRKDGVVARKNETEFVRLNQLIDNDLATDTLDAGELADELLELRNQLAAAEKESKEVLSHNTKVAAHNAKVEVIANQLVEFREDRDTKAGTLNSSMDEKSYIEILKNAFSTNGLLSYKIESSVKILEDSINEYLAEFCFFRLVFKLEGEKLNVNIIDDEGDTIPVESLSTGELARVNISTVLAIRKIMSTIANSTINFLFLDEIVGVLDDEGKEKLTDVLIKENLNTFIVSHEATHPLIPKILIEKEDKISRLSDG